MLKKYVAAVRYVEEGTYQLLFLIYATTGEKKRQDHFPQKKKI